MPPNRKYSTTCELILLKKKFESNQIPRIVTNVWEIENNKGYNQQYQPTSQNKWKKTVD